MDSLYGGQPGVSFILKESFASYSDMVKAFQQGASYTDVWYGEYCLISSKNKNNPDNGNIYKRGLDYQNKTTGGAIYLGCIVGSSSGTPFVQIGTIDDVSDMAKTVPSDTVHRRYPVGLNDDGTVKTNWQYSETTNSWSDVGGDIKDDFSFGEATKSIVPGKVVNDDGSVTYNDEIKYTWVNIRKDDEDMDSWFYVGFEFPYLVTDYKVKTVAQYDDSGNFEKDSVTIDRTDDKSHPYYQEWTLGIPKGIKGDTLRSLRVVDAGGIDKNNIYESSAIIVDSKTGLVTLGSPGYDGMEDDIDNNRQIVVFNYYIYDKRINPDPIMIYLGDFNIITGIRVADDGTLTVAYTHDDDTAFEKKIKWVQGVELTTGNGSHGGHFTLSYNNGDDSYQTDLTWVRGIEISENGTVTYTYAGTNGGDPSIDADTGKKVISNFLKWISGVSLTTGDGNAGGHFRVDYNNGSTPYETDLTWVKGIEIADDGTVTYTYAGGAYADGKQYVSNLVKWISSIDLNASNGHFMVMLNNGTAALEKDLDWVKDVSIDESTGAIVMNHTTGDVTSAAKLKLLTGMTVSSDGIPTLHFNTGSDDDFTMKGDDGKDYHIKTITNVTLNTGIREDKHINVTYNTDQAKPSPIGNSINFVRDMVVRPADWHLFVLYDDAAHRATPDSLVTDVVIENSKKVSGKDANGISWLSSTKVAGFTGSSYTGATYDIDSSMTIADLPYDVYWRDLGAIKDQAGVLIGGNITSATIKAEGYSDILVYLNAKYPSGLTGESNVFGGQSTKEKIITYQPTDDDTADKEFYAFDYNAMSWYFLGRIADTGSRDVKLIAKTEISAANLEKLNTEGLAFITQVVSASTTEIPDYWSPSYKFV